MVLYVLFTQRRFFENFQRKINLKSILPIDHDMELKLFKIFNKKYLSVFKKTI